MRDVQYTTLSGPDLYNHAENQDSYGWSMRAAIDAKSAAQNLASAGASESRIAEFHDAANAHREAADEHKTLWKNATTDKKPTGGFTASPVHNSNQSMYRNN